jgi:hypothetical protein
VKKVEDDKNRRETLFRQMGGLTTAPVFCLFFLELVSLGYLNSLIFLFLDEFFEKH